MTQVRQVRAVSLHNYIEVARFVGLDPYAMLQQVRILPNQLANPEYWLPAGPVRDLLAASAKKSGCESFGLLLADCRTFASLGPLSLLLKHLRNGREMVAEVIEHQHLLNDIINIGMDTSRSNVLLTTEFAPNFCTREVVELTVAILFRVLREALAHAWSPEAIHFRHAAPVERRFHQRVFACPTEFNSVFDGMSCTAPSLEIPNPNADAEMAEHARQLLQIVSRVRPMQTVSERVRQAIYLLIREQQPTVGGAGRNMYLRPRTLQRRLAQEGTTFGRLLNEVRCDLALRYVESSDRPIIEVAHLTGYSSHSTFTRWFANEFGETPAVRRNRSRGSARHFAA